VALDLTLFNYEELVARLTLLRARAKVRARPMKNGSLVSHPA